MSSNHCSHIKELNDVKNIIYCCDECASKFSEALKPSHNISVMPCSLQCPVCGVIVNVVSDHRCAKLD